MFNKSYQLVILTILVVPVLTVILVTISNQVSYWRISKFDVATLFNQKKSQAVGILKRERDERAPWWPVYSTLLAFAGNYAKCAEPGSWNSKIPRGDFPSTFRGAFGKRPRIYLLLSLSLVLSIRQGSSSGDNAPEEKRPRISFKQKPHPDGTRGNFPGKLRGLRRLMETRGNSTRSRLSRQLSRKLCVPFRRGWVARSNRSCSTYYFKLQSDSKVDSETKVCTSFYKYFVLKQWNNGGLDVRKPTSMHHIGSKIHCVCRYFFFFLSRTHNGRDFQAFRCIRRRHETRFVVWTHAATRLVIFCDWRTRFWNNVRNSLFLPVSSREN